MKCEWTFCPYRPVITLTAQESEAQTSCFQSPPYKGFSSWKLDGILIELKTSVAPVFASIDLTLDASVRVLTFQI